jgi:hypothetical protein
MDNRLPAAGLAPLGALAALAALALAGCYETEPPPVLCTTEFAPVCGADGNTYANACLAMAAGVAVRRAGPCVVGNPCSSDDDCHVGALCQTTRCGGGPLDGGAYDGGSAADAGAADAGAPDEPPPPACRPGSSGCTDTPAPPRCGTGGGVCEPCACARIYAPVCGADGNTYGNDCEARCAHVDVVSSGPCGTECPDLVCPPIGCEWGYKLDARGCTTCECNEPPVCEPQRCDLRCEFGFATDPATGCGVCRCNPPPFCPDILCGLYCPYGYKTDPATGCATCECVPEPECPEVLCDRFCEYGYRTDERGCATCACNPPPGDLCTSSRDCARGLECDFTTTMCTGACPPDAPCAPTVCYGTCREPRTCEPVLCTLYCAHGFKRDPRTGCEVCECEDVMPPPPPPVRLCLTERDCGRSEYCDGTVCYSAPCPPGAACPDVCYGACMPRDLGADAGSGGGGSGGGDAGTPMPRPFP